jgi:hypothetical protein
MGRNRGIYGRTPQPLLLHLRVFEQLKQRHVFRVAVLVSQERHPFG